MKIALIGYGRMGREVEEAALARGHEIGSTIDPRNGTHRELSIDALAGCDGVIEFGTAEGILPRISIVMEAGLPLVVGTTGWNGHLSAARDLVSKADGALLYGSNFSIGANLFFRMVEEAAGLINAFDEYDIMLMEYHHKMKSDSPSGTALTLAEKIMSRHRVKRSLVTEPLQRPIEAHELHVASLRGGSIPGIHRVTIDSAADSITLEHNARNRSGFALGSVRGLEWLATRSGFFHSDDFFNDLYQ